MPPINDSKINYHISDLYIALFSHFIPCGAYEGVYILDPFYQNKSDIQPDTVHADTHGQSAPIFGLAYTLGYPVDATHSQLEAPHALPAQ